MITAYLYPKCGTCRQAKKWLVQQNLPFKEINIIDSPPTKEELRVIWQKSGLPLKKLFNTSGVKYKELNLKDKIPTLSEDEQLELLASDGYLIKRPLMTNDVKATVGYDEELYTREWKNAHE